MVSSTVEVLALRCLAHLEQEDAMLQVSCELVQETRTALLRRDPSLLQGILQRQEATAAIAQKLREARQVMQSEIATHFSIGIETASLGYLIRRAAPPYRERLLSFQQRLSRAAQHVDLLNRGNVALAGQMMDLVHNVLHRLTGENPRSACYERPGSRTAQAGPASRGTSS